MVRSIITIDEDKCNGCGLCIPNCPEGAIQMIDGKARLISDLFCDGLGACLGHCPEGAITTEKREAAPYDEWTVMGNIVKAGANTIKAHLMHLRDHGETAYFATAVKYLKENNIENPLEEETTMVHQHGGGCPGSQVIDRSGDTAAADAAGTRESALRQWPVQFHLVSPNAPYFQGKDVLLAADCVAFAVGDFHKDWLAGKSLAIACPKLDEGQDVYKEKLVSLIDDAKVNTLTVMIMQVPCCGGLLALAKDALASAKRKVPLKAVVVSLKGEILSEDWVTA